MLDPDFREMLSCLRGAEVEFLVVGAYALAAHGHPRATGDIDIWVRNTCQNAQRILRALATFGAPLASLSEEDFTAADMIVQLGVEPCRINLLTGIDGVEFDEAWGRGGIIALDDLEIYVLSKADLRSLEVNLKRPVPDNRIQWSAANQSLMFPSVPCAAPTGAHH
jgi:hypothetical protein